LLNLQNNLPISGFGGADLFGDLFGGIFGGMGGGMGAGPFGFGGMRGMGGSRRGRRRGEDTYHPLR
jgi:hypothetical protein